MSVIERSSAEKKTHRNELHLTFPEVVQRLIELLGARLVAYVADRTETRTVHEWAVQDREPREPIESRLRTTLYVLEFITDADGPSVAASWLQGINPELEDRAPAELLRESTGIDDAARAIIAAARSFVS